MGLPLTCVTLSGCTVDEMLKDAARATAVGADLVEVRLDKLWVVKQQPEPVEKIIPTPNKPRPRPVYVAPEFTPQPMDSVDLDSAIISFKTGIELPVIMTCRSNHHDGYFPGSEEERIEVLTKAIKSGVSWVDLEIDIDSKVRKKLMKLAGKNTSIVASLHSDDSVFSSDEIIQEVEENQSAGEVIKMCFKSTGKNDGLRIFKAAWNFKESEIKTAIMGSGLGGDWSRIHAPLLGQHLVYTTMETGWHLSQEGRINASDLKTAWKLLEYS